MSPTELAYRKTAIGGASGFGLLIALCDTLAGDLRRAADAERRNNIEKRCREVNHALLVIAHLEDGLARGAGGELARQLSAFYSSLRRAVNDAQACRSPEMLEQQMNKVLNLRGVWQGLELRNSSAMAEAPARAQAPRYPGTSPARYERSASSWRA
jgi:flagellin-specific chaperone FliS